MFFIKKCSTRTSFTESVFSNFADQTGNELYHIFHQVNVLIKENA